MAERNGVVSRALGSISLTVVLFTVALAGLVGMACNAQLDETLQVGLETELVVRNFNGRVRLTAGEPGQVRVQADVRGTRRVAYSITQHEDVVTVEAKPQSSILHIGPDVGVHLTITAPASVRMNVQTTNGLIVVRGFQRGATLVTSNGRVTVANTTGDVAVETANGPITLDDFVGTAHLKASFGSVVLKAVKGAFQVEAEDAIVVFDGELTAGGQSRLSTTNGRVSVTLQGTPSLQLDALVHNGSVTNEVPIEATIVEEGRLVGMIGAGEAELEIRVENGLVTIQPGLALDP